MKALQRTLGRGASEVLLRCAAVVAAVIADAKTEPPPKVQQLISAAVAATVLATAGAAVASAATVTVGVAAAVVAAPSLVPAAPLQARAICAIIPKKASGGMFGGGAGAGGMLSPRSVALIVPQQRQPLAFTAGTVAPAARCAAAQAAASVSGRQQPQQVASSAFGSALLGKRPSPGCAAMPAPPGIEVDPLERVKRLKLSFALPFVGVVGSSVGMLDGSVGSSLLGKGEEGALDERVNGEDEEEDAPQKTSGSGGVSSSALRAWHWETTRALGTDANGKNASVLSEWSAF